MSLLVVGSVAYDGVETPHGKVDRMLGGAATYIALAASYFTPVKIVAVVGDDFAQQDIDLLASRGIDLPQLSPAEVSESAAVGRPEWIPRVFRSETPRGQRIQVAHPQLVLPI